MFCTSKNLCLPPAISAWLFTVAAWGAEPTPDAPPAESKLPSISQQLADIQKSLQKLDGLKSDVQSWKTSTELLIQRTIGDLELLREQVRNLKSDVEALRGQSSQGGRISMAAPPPGGTGRIVLRNSYNESVSVILNGTSYQLAPGESWTLENQSSGAFTYEVLGGPRGAIQGRVSRNLVAGETFTIVVYPR